MTTTRVPSASGVAVTLTRPWAEPAGRPVSATAVSAGAPGAVRSTVKVEVIGVASTLPAASVAAIATWWSPLARPVRAHGLVHGAAVASSSAQVKVMSSSSGPSSNVTASRTRAPAAGPAVIAVSGAVVSYSSSNGSEGSLGMPAAPIAATV